MENSVISEIKFDEQQQIDSLDATWTSVIKEKVLNETEKFFGVVSPHVGSGSDFCEAIEENLKWQLRRFRHICKQYSPNEGAITEVLHTNIGSLESLESCVDSDINQDSSRLAFPSSAFFRSVAAGSAPLLSASNVAADSFPNQHQSRGFSSAYKIIEEHIPPVPDVGREEHNRQSRDADFFAAGNMERECCKHFCRPSGQSNLRKPTKSPELLLELARHPRLINLDYRAFFSYWITVVQTIVMLFIIFYYGIGTDFSSGLGVIERSGNVMTASLSLRRIVVWEQNNVWIGPNYADLVRAGAKYTPCMRYDHSIHEQVKKERQEEAENTGCCLRLGGCYQTSECPKQFARLLKWSDSSSNSEQLSTRIVCGQDPRYCRNPKSMPPFQWNSSDVSEWPICEEKVPQDLIPRTDEHMHCEITGRPCCIQMHGQCRITSKPYCDFVRGTYHPDATLCSQVSCLNDVCGMTPFLNHRPDQMHRLVTPLFIHAGLVRCVISILFQMTIMRKFETMVGWLRLSIIYFCSGIGGYLASSIFVPYMPEAGPAGSHGGVLGALIINILYNWRFLQNPKHVLLVHLSIAGAFFLTGFLPFIDNWAQLVGFVIGSLLAPALIPYFNFGARTRHWRLLIVSASLSLTLMLFLLLFSTFYAHSVLSYHKLSSLLNCPFSGSKVCDQQGLILKSWLPI